MKRDKKMKLSFLKKKKVGDLNDKMNIDHGKKTRVYRHV